MTAKSRSNHYEREIQDAQVRAQVDRWEHDEGTAADHPRHHHLHRAHLRHGAVSRGLSGRAGQEVDGLLKSVRVKRYTDYHTQRVYDYQYFLVAETNANEENKFLMNITEQDMEDFVKGTHMKVRKVSDNDLVGKWE